MRKQSPVMEYMEYMERSDHELLEEVQKERQDYRYEKFTKQDVQAALEKSYLNEEDFKALLSPAAAVFLEDMAVRAQAETRKHFGNAVSLFTPLYIANYCENHCVYCGFNCKNRIHRGRLEQKEIESELQAIARTGLQEILLLTGESRVKSDVEYIGEAVKAAARYFSTVGIEIYPLNTEEYAYLQQCGADFVSVYQETYNREVYDKLHLSGPKRVYPYRFYAQERALKAGMRGVAFGSLLGLDDFRKDALAAGLHAQRMQQKYPHGEISFSFPRLRPFVNHQEQDANQVGERQLLQVMMAYRLFLPYAGITISTRENARFRNHVIRICATKISAGVRTGVGGHEEEQKGDEQFEISDPRNVNEVHQAILDAGLQPVYTDYVRV